MIREGFVQYNRGWKRAVLGSLVVLLLVSVHCANVSAAADKDPLDLVPSDILAHRSVIHPGSSAEFPTSDGGHSDGSLRSTGVFEIGGRNSNDCEEDSGQPIDIRMTIASLPRVGEETTLSYTVTSDTEAPGSMVTIDLPSGVTLISGTIERTLDLVPGASVTDAVRIRFDRPGDYRIYGTIRAPPAPDHTWVAGDALYVTIGDSTSEYTKPHPSIGTMVRSGRNVPNGAGVEGVLPSISLEELNRLDAMDEPPVEGVHSPATSQVSIAGTVTVTGTFVYLTTIVNGKENDYRIAENGTVPLKRALVRIRDAETGDLLWQDYTSYDGTISAPIPNPYPRQIAVYIYAYYKYQQYDGLPYKLRVLNDPEDYSAAGLDGAYAAAGVYGPISPDAPTFDLGTLQPPGGSGSLHAFWLFEDLVRTKLFLPQRDLGSVTVVWYPTVTPSDLAVYHGGSYIEIGGENFRSADTTVHETGHNYMYSIHGSVSGDCPSPHFMQSASGPICGYTEGWPDFLSLAVNGNSIYSWSNGGSFDLEPPTWDWTGIDDGYQVEGRVAGALWDMLDTESDGYDDGHSYEYAWIDTTMRATPEPYFQSFWNTWRALGYPESAKYSIYQNTIDYSFNVPPQSFTITCPNGGEAWEVGSQHSISWDEFGLAGSNVKIKLFNDLYEHEIASFVQATDGEVSWWVPSSVKPATNYRICIRTIGSPLVEDYSDSDFTIKAKRKITLTAPNGGESWQAGSTHDITWTQASLEDTNVHIVLLKGPDGVLTRQITASVPAADGSFSWTIPEDLTPASDYWISILCNDQALDDDSDGYFTIAPSIYTPQISSIIPPSATDGATSVPVTISARHVYAGATASLLRHLPAPLGDYRIPLQNLQITPVPDGGGRQWIDGTFDLSSALPGNWTVEITNPDTQRGEFVDGFYVYPGLVITGVEPNSGRSQGAVLITNLSGRGFQSGANVSFRYWSLGHEATLYATNVDVRSENRITCRFDLVTPMGAGITPGTYDLTVTNLDGKSATLTRGFTVLPAAPTVTDITPTHGAKSTRAAATITGTHFASGADVWLQYNVPAGHLGVTHARNVNVTSATRITCTLDVPTLATSGPAHIVVQNPDMGTGWLENGFTIDPGYITEQLSASTIPRGASVTISGTNTDNITTYLFMTGPACATAGSPLTDIYKSAADGFFTTVATEGDGSYQYLWDTDAVSRLQTGTYRIYACSDPVDVNHLAGHPYVFTEITIRLPQRSLTVTIPNGGEAWQAGTQHTITWSQTDLESTNVRLSLWEYWPTGTFIREIAPSVFASNGSYAWTIPADIPPATDYWVNVSSLADPTVMDETDGWLEITPVTQTITVTSPNGGETWAEGFSYPVTWTQTGLTSTNVKIELYTRPTSMSPWTYASTIRSSVAATAGGASWLIRAGTASDGQFQVRVSSLANTSVTDASNAPFYLIPTPTLAVTVPNGGEAWQAGSTHTITWTQTGLAGTNVRLTLWEYQPTGTFIREIVPSVTAAGGSYEWTIPTDITPATGYGVNISSITYPTIVDRTDGFLEITAPSNPVPSIASISPTSVPMGSPSCTLTVTGTQFVPTSKVRWNTYDLVTTYVSATQVTAVVPESYLGLPGTATIKVVSPPPGGGASNGITFTIGEGIPVASFTTITPRIGTGPLTVTFQDTSTNTPTSWRWAYRSATGSWTRFSTAQNPVFTFPVGTYDINLTATNADGSDDELKTGYIVASEAPPPPPEAAFTNTTPRIGTGPLTVTFRDTSMITPTSWRWAYKSATGSWTQFSTAQNPTFTFPVGTYDINLTATNSGGSDDEVKSGYVVATEVPPVASFTTMTPRIGTGPLTVTFQDTSTNAPTSWRWAYKGETAGWTQFSTAQNPTFTFPVGTYDINLTATNAGGNDDEVKTGFVVVTTPPPVLSVSKISPGKHKHDGKGFTAKVNGTGFDTDNPGTKVLLWKTAMTKNITGSGVTVQSDSGLVTKFRIPKNAKTGAYNVTVINPDGRMDTLSKGFRIVT